MRLKPELQQEIAARQQMLARVRAMLVEDLRVRRDPEEIDPDAPLFGTGLGLDSVDAIDLVVAIETRFGCKLPKDGGFREHLRTVNGLVEFLLK